MLFQPRLITRPSPSFVSSRLRGKHAFPLVDVMTMVVIIGLMAGLVTYATAGYLDRAKR